ncbi:hypothetical protein AJ78_01041 [Emergomyces pasteurianus Ep9510]|uniref:Uncharacterized protein n=1 Tax=Emergomyces pasteurianus Ep9510 TaxID=1447872 RepID=A0A1J9QFQ1_9EURO|nr:hypothetical protein AJ78_01041 [Emergomyces pasteurianus Ep9510]
MSSNTVYAITGANRGLGLGLVKTYLSRPNITVIGIVRNSAGARMLRSAISAAAEARGTNSILYTVEIDFSDSTITEAPEQIRELVLTGTDNIAHINTLILSAATLTPMVPTLSITAADLRKCFQVNTIAPLMTFKALWPLLQAAEGPKKFIMISSSVASIGAMEPLAGSAYAMSKVAMNWATKSLHEQIVGKDGDGDGLVSVVVHPGWSSTEMGVTAAGDWNVDVKEIMESGHMVTVDQSVKRVVSIVDGVTRERDGGKFLTGVTGSRMEVPW